MATKHRSSILQCMCTKCDDHIVHMDAIDFSTSSVFPQLTVGLMVGVSLCDGYSVQACEC